MLPLLIGLGISGLADAQAQAKREKLLNAMRAYQVGQTGATRGAIEGLIAAETPQARATDLANKIAERSDSLQKSVDSVQTTNPAPIAGKVSEDYKGSQAAAASRVADRTKRAIEQLSVMGAPGEDRLASGIRYGRAAGVVDAANSAIGNVGNAYMTHMNNTVPNPGMKLVGGALASYGAAKMGAGTGGTTSPGWGDTMGTSGAFEDSAGNMQQSPYRVRTRNGFSLWGKR